MIRLSFIPQQFVKAVQATRPDLAAYVVAGIHIDAGAPGVARAWKVNADHTDGGKIDFGNIAAAKDDFVSVAILPDGSVRLVVSEAEPNASGSTMQPNVYTVAGVFPPAPPVPAGGGGEGLTFIAALGGYIRLHGGPFSGQATISLGNFGIAAGAVVLNLKITVSAAAPDIRGCVGPHTGSSGAAMMKVETQRGNGGVVGKGRIYAEGQRTPGADNTLVLMAEGGDLAEFYVDYIGGWY